MDWLNFRDIMEIHNVCATMMHEPWQTSTCDCRAVGGVPTFGEDI